jgi:pimeloyl-ACP methyl ester carboxylesterase
VKRRQEHKAAHGIGLLAALTILATAASAHASGLASLPCAGNPGFICSSLPVPLDRANPEAGTISLAVERKLAGTAPAGEAVLMLAGGPGQAAVPFASHVPTQIGASLKTRDLIVMDQRGTGKSARLGCPALEAFNGGPLAKRIEACADQIGQAREAFTTAETVQDIEALRVAGGYQKLVLYGTSYGTKVALEYAERYPGNVGALLLDSVVPSGEEEPFQEASFRAITPVMDDLCTRGACAGITTHPVGDLARVDAHMNRHMLIGGVYNGTGKRRRWGLAPSELYGLLIEGDLNPVLRAMLPGAVSDAAKGDPAPLLRLNALTEGFIPSLAANEPEGAFEEGSEDNVLYADTICEETPFPWSRLAPAAARLSEARTALHRLPAGAFYPFTPTTAYVTSDLSLCAPWPDAGPPPAPERALPDVPTLILSGEQDLRTPTSEALRVAARIADAQVELVPFTGHSVLGDDLTGCASKAVTAFFKHERIAPCNTAKDPIPVSEAPPSRLRSIAAPRALAGKAGQTLVAAYDTLRDLSYVRSAAALESGFLAADARFGGLHGGYARQTPTALILHRYSYIPGVLVSGTVPRPTRASRTRPAVYLTISGPQAADGTIVFVGTRARGTLGGTSFNISDPRATKAAITPDGLPSDTELQALVNRTATARAERATGRVSGAR